MKINDILTFYDKILIIILIVIALILLILPFYIFSSDSQEMVLKVQLKDKIIKTVPLSESYDQKITFKVEGPIGTHIIEADQGRVRVKEAPEEDPLKICKKTGWIDSEGPIIVCVPNNLSLWLESDNSELDGTSW